MSAEELKNKGNAFFSEKKFPEAVAAFTEAIAVDANNHVLYSNRSASYAGMEVRFARQPHPGVLFLVLLCICTVLYLQNV